MGNRGDGPELGCLITVALTGSNDGAYGWKHYRLEVLRSHEHRRPLSNKMLTDLQQSKPSIAGAKREPSSLWALRCGMRSLICLVCWFRIKWDCPHITDAAWIWECRLCRFSWHIDEVWYGFRLASMTLIDMSYMCRVLFFPQWFCLELLSCSLDRPNESANKKINDVGNSYFLAACSSTRWWWTHSFPSPLSVCRCKPL